MISSIKILSVKFLSMWNSYLVSRNGFLIQYAYLICTLMVTTVWYCGVWSGRCVNYHILQAIGARNMLKSIAKERESYQHQLQTLITEKKIQLERWGKVAQPVTRGTQDVLNTLLVCYHLFLVLPSGSMPLTTLHPVYVNCFLSHATGFDCSMNLSCRWRNSRMNSLKTLLFKNSK